ncbi:MAG: DUF3553 domain-containing protein [Alphaproteobacteria bacterium]|nr:DUF3553 domain-containing protein [Alphaproteobacteria bacterium]
MISNYADDNVLVPGDLVPGRYVRHPDAPDWGIGQVQSCVGTRVTVNFEECGKVLIDTSVIGLVAADAEIDA